jgi:hypothetical protein
MNADEQQDLRKLLQLLERTTPWEQLIGNPTNAWQVQAGSALAGDDAKTAPYQLSHAAWHALTVAVDHLCCFRDSLLGELKEDQLTARIRTHAQSSLVRGAIENSARAVWLLGPANRRTRVSRRLALEAMEVRSSYRFRGLARAPARRTQEERETQLRDLAVAAGVPALDMKKTCGRRSTTRSSERRANSWSWAPTSHCSSGAGAAPLPMVISLGRLACSTKRSSPETRTLPIPA